MSVSASIHLLVGLKSHPAKLQLLKMRPISYTMTLSAVSASPNQSNLTMDPILQIQLSNVSPRFLKFVISSLATPCYPQSNGRAERLIGTLGSISPRYRRGRRNRHSKLATSDLYLDEVQACDAQQAEGFIKFECWTMCKRALICDTWQGEGFFEFVGWARWNLALICDTSGRFRWIIILDDMGKVPLNLNYRRNARFRWIWTLCKRPLICYAQQEEGYVEFKFSTECKVSLNFNSRRCARFCRIWMLA